LQAGELAESTERLNTWAAAVVAKEQCDGTFNLWEPIFTRGLQAIRLKATYVDVTPTGDVQTDPNTIDDDFAKYMCTGALAFLVMVLMLTMYTRKGVELRDIMEPMAEYITGLDALRKVFPSLVAKAEAAGRAA
jgi:hypothetical protein